VHCDKIAIDIKNLLLEPLYIFSVQLPEIRMTAGILLLLETLRGRKQELSYRKQIARHLHKH